MLTIRLARSGAKKRPFYHISVADSRMPRDGRFVERVGYYNPIASGQEVRLEVDVERIDYWISKGAQPSDRVLNLLKQNKETPEQTEKRLADKEAKRVKKLARKVAAKEAEAAPAKEAKRVKKLARKVAAKEAEATPAEETSEEAPAEDAAPAEEEAKTEEAPAEEAAPEEAPAEEEAKAEEAPAEEAAPAEEETPAEEEDEGKSS